MTREEFRVSLLSNRGETLEMLTALVHPGTTDSCLENDDEVFESILQNLARYSNEELLNIAVSHNLIG